jgi:hypothetical protein
MAGGMNNREHYITKSFVRERFGTNGFVNRYNVEHDSWKMNASPKSLFFGFGYTQFLAEAQPLDDSLETSFHGLENKLPSIMPALDAAAEQTETQFPEDDYHTLCFYCAYLWYLSPFAKATAPTAFVMELDSNLGIGNWDYLRQRGKPEDEIQRMKTQYDNGFRFILQGENYMQILFRDQFVRKCKEQAAYFRYRTEWTVYNSPLELPISDIAVVDYPESKTVTRYILPISPSRVLIGRFHLGSPPAYHSTDTIVYGNTLTLEAAEYVRDIVCASAVKAVVCKSQMDIKGFRERAKDTGIRFPRIKNLADVLSAGSKVFDPETLRLVPVSHNQFFQYVDSFIEPAQ